MTGELTLLKGKVKNLHKYHTTKAIFDNDFETKAGAAAVGAAAVGAFANAAVFTSLSSRARNHVQQFSCTVKGVELSGYFEAVTFKEGDNIEFVVEYNPNNPQEAVVHASRDAKRKIVSFIPYQHQGETAYKKSALKLALGFSVFMSLLAFIAIFFTTDFNNDDYGIDALLIDVLFCIGGGGVIFLVFMLASRKEIPDAIKATKVFAALGYKNPALADAVANHIPAQEAWKEKKGKFESLGLKWVHRYQDSDLEK